MTYDSIQVLEGIQHIRLRPGMYIGDTSNANHLLAEVLDNCLDEAMAGHCSEITIQLEKDHFTIIDDGRGIPLKGSSDVAPIVTICSKLFSGGKFNKDNYKVSAGLHGVGITAVNATSKKFQITTVREFTFNDAVFHRGELVEYKEGTCKLPNGVTVHVYPDEEIFESISVDAEYVAERCQIASTFIPNLSIILNGKQLPKTKPENLIKTDTPVWYLDNKNEKGERIQVWFGYSESKSDDDADNGSVNLLPVNYGTHVNVARDILIEAWKPLVDGFNQEIQPSDVLRGLRMYTFAMLSDPKYASQIKDRLSNKKSDLKDLYDPLIKQVREQLAKNSKMTQKLLQKFADYRKHINSLSNNRYLADVLEMGETGDQVSRRGVSMDSKLVDCRSRDKESTELFIVEGDSAGGGLITKRNPNIHAVLPLRGKVLNVIDMDVRSVMQNREIRSLINAIGVGLKSLEDVEKCKYGKIIIGVDSDVDGKNIAALLVGALCALTPALVKAGRVYICDSPLYGQYDKKNKFIPVYDEKDINRNIHFQRFKGLGEMNANEIQEVFFNNSRRRLIQVTLKDAMAVTRLVGGSAQKKQVLVDAGVLR